MQAQPPSDIITTPPTRLSEPRKLDHASINSMAYDLVTGVEYKAVCEAYMLDLKQLHHELTTNEHLKEALRNWKTGIKEDGAFGAAIEAAASETLPHILRDNVDSATEAAVRSRNMKMFMDYKIQREKIKADLQKSDKVTSPALGVQVNFNVSPGIRGISALHRHH